MQSAPFDVNDFYSHLKQISQTNGPQRQALVEQFQKKYPDKLDWLDAVPKDSEAAIEPGFMPEIPGYKLVKLIGRGANGRVFLATDQSGRQCAVKIPNMWLNDDQLSRFHHEVKVLSRLDHPNIAKVKDFGDFQVADQKLPFLVMDYIPGIAIDRYVQQQSLSATQIIDLSLQVLDALQYAHLKSVIHRDIKPDNIIVKEDGQPILLDFGIATLGDDATHMLTQLTGTGDIVGTLAYMSPEQITGSDKSDLRSDIYAMGVVIYQLLSGRLPIQVDAGQFFSAVHDIINQTPPSLATINRDIDDGLAAVVHHAMEKNAKQRYQSVSELLKDLSAWLNQEPLSVAHLSSWYWLKQAARKNKALVTGASLAFLGLLTGLVFAVSFGLKEQQARSLAEQKAESNRQVVQFINDLFVNADPTESLGEAITVKQVIQGAQYSVDKDLSDEPQVEAQIRLVLGNVFDAIELYPAALSQYQKGLDRLETKDQLYFEIATQKLITLASNTQFEQLMLSIEQLKAQLHNADLNEREINALNNKILFEEATFYTANGKMVEALAVINELQQQTDLDLNQQFAVNKYRAHIHRQMGEVHQAEKLFRSELEKAKTVFGESHPTTLSLIQELTLALQETNKIDEALELYDTLIEGMKQNYGENSASTFVAKMNKATTYMYAGDFAQADVMTAELLPKMIEHIGPMHQFTLTLRSIRGGVLDNTGQLDEALAMYQETLDLFLQSESKDNYTTLIIPHNMAIVYNKQSKYQKANEVYKTYRPQCEATLSLEHPLCIIMADSHADILIQLGEYKKAAELMAYSNPALIEKYGAEHYRVIESNKRLKKLDKLMGID
ncbi:serine/threonine-protein kinase [Marinicella gelatinilytica]|uniref:serine/threonine-protein kinase n=1 Tax=Marinicella gelatinilytica TaxID=2996017 RepID=UPI002260E8F5|nr:serine/threonine-protein kinase [Marinicella gelatinilytica]MCX7545867.1 serine/threonine-protein kinase [Marinicella gelatinilytica]